MMTNRSFPYSATGPIADMTECNSWFTDVTKMKMRRIGTAITIYMHKASTVM